MKTPLFLAAVFLTPLIVSAQSTEPMKTKALSFNINGLYLSGVNGGMGGKIWIPGNRALVGSVDAGISHDVREASDSLDRDDVYNTSSLAVTVGIEQHFPWTPGLSPYLTGGLSLSRDGSINRGGSVSFPSRNEEWGVSVGARGGFGLEYWLAPRVSIAGQQLLAAAYRFGAYNSSSSPSRDTRRFTLDLGTSALILSVYL